MAVQEDQLGSSSSLLLDNLYCEEENWEEEEEEETEENHEDDEIYNHGGIENGPDPPSRPLIPLCEQDLFWEEPELLTLLAKEKQQKLQTHPPQMDSDSSIALARREAVEWMLKANARHRFSALTAILAVDYLDRFIPSIHFQGEKPWMIQLVAVTCLSLAAKVEETQVPALPDFQVEETEYVFETKMIQRMELLVLSALEWRMNPVTPLSFLDHIIRRLGLRNRLHWEFLRRSQLHLLSVAADPRYPRYLPSVLAAATMMHVIEQVEPRNPIEYQNQLMGVLKISKEEVNQCYQQVITNPFTAPGGGQNKRKSGGISSNEWCHSGISSNESWARPLRPSVFPEEGLAPNKRIRAHEQYMPFRSINGVFVDALASPL